jgi:hypothetical protein
MGSGITFDESWITMAKFSMSIFKYKEMDGQLSAFSPIVEAPWRGAEEDGGR